MDEIYERVSEELGIPVNRVKKIYRAFWKEIKNHISSLPLKNDLTKEEFDNIHPCINIPSLGKLYINFEKYKRIEKYFKIKKIKEDATHKED